MPFELRKSSNVMNDQDLEDLLLSNLVRKKLTLIIMMMSLNSLIKKFLNMR